ncbi:alpha/beta hydrolase [Nocardia sp. NPDC055029]
MTSPESALLLDAYRDLAARLRAQPTPDIRYTRTLYEELHAVTAEPEGVCYAEANANGIPALWCVPNDSETGTALLFAHGGGFQVGSTSLYRKLAGHLAARAGVPALLFDYRLAPEFPYPAQLSDFAAVERWLAQRDVSMDRVVVVGDSAGANLATMHVLRSTGNGFTAPAGMVAFSPWYDLTLSSPSVTSRRKLDVAVSRSGLSAMRDSYLADGPGPDDPAVNPMNADLARMPPTLVLTGDHEILLDDTLRFADRARAVGVSIDVGIYPGMPHVFPLLAGRAPEADAAVDRAGRWARARLGLPPRPAAL